MPTRALGLLLTTLMLCADAGAEDWPQHLGTRRDGTSHEQPPSPWGSAGPKRLWVQEVGPGFAAPVVANGSLVIFHRIGAQEVIDSLDVATGRRHWRLSYPTAYRDDFGFDEGPRSAPTVADGTIFAFGAEGTLTAVSAESGARLWQVDTHRRFEVRKGFFGAAGAPLVHDGRLFLNVGGDDAGIVALDATTGETVWAATDHAAGYSSGVVAPLGGDTRVIFFTREGLAVADPASGRVTAEMPWRARNNASVNAATPLVAGNRVFLSASYRTGAILLDLTGGSPEPVWSSDDALSSHYSTGVLHQGRLYGFHGRQEYGPAFRCVELASGKLRWSEDRFGAGSVTLVGDRLVVLDESGTLHLVRTDPDRFNVEARAEILTGTVRAYPAYADGVLYARNGQQLAAFELR